MAADIATLGFNVDTKGLTKGEKALSKYASTGDKVERKTEKNAQSMGASYKMLAGIIGSVAAAVATLNNLITVSREFDVLNAQLITATGSAENAAIAFEAIQKFAATTPYDLAQATKGFTQLVNLGLTPSEAALVSYGNTASAMGKDLSQMIEAVADATVGEFERLKEFGIKSKSEGDNVSFTFRGVTKTIAKEAAAIEGYLMALGENEFAGAMAERSKTLDGAISNLGDSWNSLLLTVSKMGVGSIMRDSVIIAANATQSLDNWIASGAFVQSLNAVVGRFNGFAKDVTNAMGFVSEIIGNSTDGWSEDAGKFFDNMLEGFKVLPEMTRFFIQLAAVNVGKFVEYAKIYGDAFVDVMSLRFKRLVEIAKFDGLAIANALNPFSDSIDYTAGREAISAEFAVLEGEILNNASKRVDIASQVADDVISMYALEASAATSSYKERIDLSKQMLDAYSKEKGADKGDVLSQFKIIADTAGGTSESLANAEKDYAKWIAGIEASTGQLEKLEEEIISVMLAMDDPTSGLSQAAGLEYIEQLKEKIESLKKTMSGVDLFESMTDSVKNALGAVQDLSAQGSKDYAKLGVAIQAVNAIQAIGAVLNQGNGDPYTAFARMSAMAAAVASIAGVAVSVGSLGGSLSDDSAANQASQGLSGWGEKAASIENSIESTADSTKQLVGINTDMLTALQTLQSSLAAAAGIVYQAQSGASYNVDDNVVSNIFSGITDNSIFKALDIGGIGGFLMDTIGGFLGGSSKVTDSGIKIMGGAIADLIDGATVYAFQDVKSKKYAWSSTKRKEYLDELTQANDQFGLVFESLVNTVYMAGNALGISSAELETRINAFNVATTKISLKDLSIAEQQAEIEAVFSQIFNDLANSVIPFVAEFQATGEELGETLTRLATQVQVAEYAAENLGVELGDKLANPYLFAQISDNLAELVGGVENFANSIASFIDEFASDEIKLGINSKALTEALAAVGLAVPETAAGFWDLMQGLDGTTEAGQAQIAALLNIQGVASDYYDLLSDRESEKLAEEQARQSEVDSFNSSLKSLVGSIDSTIEAMLGINKNTEMANRDLDVALAAARGGNFNPAMNLNLSALSNSTEGYSSATDFAIAQAVTANKLQDLADLAGNTATYEDMLLSANENQVDLLASIDSNLSNDQAVKSDNNENIITELRESNKKLANALDKSNDLIMAQNRLQAETADGIDRLVNNGVEIIA